MNIARRGFLHTLAAAAVGAAVFDPKSLLWVPQAQATVIGVALTGTETAATVMAEQLELNELALHFARMLADRLERHASVTLREVMFKHAGHVHLPGSLDVDGMGRGYFEPARRLMKTGAFSSTASASYVRNALGDFADQMMGDIRGGLDLFAPVSSELRPGVPFSDDVLIGVATDPESGLSARVLRFQQEGRHGRMQTLTAAEVAAGRWTTRRPKLARLYLEV